MPEQSEFRQLSKRPYVPVQPRCAAIPCKFVVTSRAGAQALLAKQRAFAGQRNVGAKPTSIITSSSAEFASGPASHNFAAGGPLGQRTWRLATWRRASYSFSGHALTTASVIGASGIALSSSARWARADHGMSHAHTTRGCIAFEAKSARS
mmetsp:Transcript_82173/g.229052  ORF Transcript_82173/g.229052 Transcript_82173/m.229052 type:complete len:151 (-) Transcript_82173:2733-3185(-)